MKIKNLRPALLFLNVFFVLFLFCLSPAHAVDGKKWDGKAYPFKSLDSSQPNSESNPFIIDTAGKLAYLHKLANIGDMVGFGEKNGLKGLRHSFKDNFVKLTVDLDMNGALYEFIPIPDTWINFDGGGHVITNLRISDKKTEPIIDDMEGTAEMRLALFQGVEQVKNLTIGKGSTITYNREFYQYKTFKILLTVYAASIAVEPNVMEGCSSEATITVKGSGEAIVGGLAAICKYTMSNSHFGGTIVVEGNIVDVKAKNNQSIVSPGNLQIGGVCAEAGAAFAPNLKHGGIFGCYNTGTITVKASGNEMQIGGVLASVGYRCECTDIYNTGKLNISATGDIKSACIGGVVGAGNTTNPPMSRPMQYIEPGKIYNSGNIDVVLKTGKKIAVGGIGGGELGDKPGFHNSSYPFGGVGGYINTCNTGSITVSSTEKVDALNVGGIAGFGRMVINSYNTGSINGVSGTGTTLNAGGIGGSSVYAQNCYNIGALSVTGSGTNVVGGVIGLADVLWGEDENHKSAAMNIFWLKQPQPGGINSDITYGKGSYYYKKNGSKMVEDFHLGATYFFENPTATVLARSDDGPGKRKAYEGSLLQALNELAEQRSDRNYHKWKVDGSNGGYPVFE
ncbi:MAG TPA: hypothetical protein DD458_16975 [Prolixibacteraceae bacterium]|nr:MAG: hypothetical protein A2W92_02165 [Bacteroidetes bacterium GWA2_42_15]OFX99403.1 MAG: hypothetical protein A2W89_12250 [Bacteroidetes bacterium GWE2_42_39]HBL76923.1 hypothetical protein [Prolixibacteraceae bacterium]HCU62697.1 hypothetical protein [Prolixibacteraceae bacterium]